MRSLRTDLAEVSRVWALFFQIALKADNSRNIYLSFKEKKSV